MQLADSCGQVYGKLPKAICQVSTRLTLVTLRLCLAWVFQYYVHAVGTANIFFFPPVNTVWQYWSYCWWYCWCISYSSLFIFLLSLFSIPARVCCTWCHVWALWGDGGLFGGIMRCLYLRGCRLCATSQRSWRCQTGELYCTAKRSPCSSGDMCVRACACVLYA